MSQISFNATQVAPSTGARQPVPGGTYSVILVSSDIKTKDQQKPKNRVLAAEAKILDGPLAGQQIPISINIGHENPTAERIGQEQLSAICHVVNVLQINDTTQLHGRPFQMKVSVEEETDSNGKPTGKRYQRVDQYLYADGRPISGGAAPANGAAQTPPGWVAAAGAPAPVPAPAPVAAVPAPVPVAAPAPVPAPAPVAAAPAGVPAWMQGQAAPPPPGAPVAPPVAPVVAAPPAKLYHVANMAGQILTQSPVDANTVKAMGPLAQLNVCENGQQAWTLASTVIA
jgi:hypothetical protein